MTIHYLLPNSIDFACRIPWPAEYSADSRQVSCEACKAALTEAALSIYICPECGSHCSPPDDRGFCLCFTCRDGFRFKP